MPLRRSRKRRSRSRCRYGRKKSARRGCKSRPGPKRRRSRRRSKYSYRMFKKSAKKGRKKSGSTWIGRRMDGAMNVAGRVGSAAACVTGMGTC